MWSFQWASKGNLHPVKNIDENKITAFTESFDLKYYNVDIHRAAFALPTFVQKQLKEVESKIETTV